jgi:hypothetical protein
MIHGGTKGLFSEQGFLNNSSVSTGAETPAGIAVSRSITTASSALKIRNIVFPESF